MVFLTCYTNCHEHSSIHQRNPKRNLLVEAISTSVLFKAETDLRIKQVSRIQNWQQKWQLVGDVNYQNGGFDCDLNHRRKYDIQCNHYVNTINFNYYRSNNENFNDIWSISKIHSFNLFMSQLSGINIYIYIHNTTLYWYNGIDIIFGKFKKYLLLEKDEKGKDQAQFFI